MQAILYKWFFSCLVIESVPVFRKHPEPTSFIPLHFYEIWGQQKYVYSNKTYNFSEVLFFPETTMYFDYILKYLYSFDFSTSENAETFCKCQ